MIRAVGRRGGRLLLGSSARRALSDLQPRSGNGNHRQRISSSRTSCGIRGTLHFCYGVSSSPSSGAEGPRRGALGLEWGDRRRGPLPGVAGGAFRRGGYRNKSSLAALVYEDSDGDSSSDSEQEEGGRGGTFDADRQGQVPSGGVAGAGAGQAYGQAYGQAGSTIPFKLADIGEGIKEVELLQWFVREGDPVRQFDKVCEVQSDKATVEISSRYDGIVAKVYHSVGDTVETGCTLIDICADDMTLTAGNGNPLGARQQQQQPLVIQQQHARNGSASVMHSAWEHDKGAPRLDIPPSAPMAEKGPQQRRPSAIGDTAAAVAVGDTVASKRGGERKKALATPAVRHIAKTHGIDIAQVVGTGPRGRITKADVTNFVAVPSSSVGDTAAGAAAAGEGEQGQQGQQQQLGQVVEIKGVQRAMLEAMKKSLQIPHMVFCDEVEVGKLSALRSEIKAAALASLRRAEEGEEQAEVKVSFLPIIIKATSMALKHFPILNSSLSDCETTITCHPHHHIGIAMHTPKGLLVPSLKFVQQKSILDIAQELTALQRRGAEGKLSEEDLRGSTFTLSNIGSIGGTYASPIIMAPQVAIGAFGRIRTVPRYADEVSADANSPVIPTKVLSVSWSGDHRIIDGSTIASFSNCVKAYLQNPATMLAESA